MNVSGTTAFFAEFGRVGRVFLQPDIKTGMRLIFSYIFNHLEILIYI